MKKAFKLKIDNIIVGLLVFATFVAGGVLVSTKVKADNVTVVDEVTIMIPASCSMSDDDENDEPHTAEVMPDSYTPDIGITNIRVFCNDFAGFVVYAKGFSGVNGAGGNNMIGTTTGQTITTGTAEGGNVSNWAMKLIKVANTTYNPDNLSIVNGYNNYHAVPSDYTRVIEYKNNSGSATTDKSLGAHIQTTYAAFVSGSQAADTYEGKVKYLLMHPATMEPGTYTLVYNKNGGGNSSTMGNETVLNYETHTLKKNTFGNPSGGYTFAGWCTIQDTTQTPQTTCKGMSYADQGVLPASPDPDAKPPKGQLTLYAYWRKT